MIVLGAARPLVRVAVSNCMQTGEGIRKDSYPFMSGKEDRIYCHQFRPHDSAGFFCAICVNVEGCACRNVYRRGP